MFSALDNFDDKSSKVNSLEISDNAVVSTLVAHHYFQFLKIAFV